MLHPQQKCEIFRSTDIGLTHTKVQILVFPFLNCETLDKSLNSCLNFLICEEAITILTCLRGLNEFRQSIAELLIVIMNAIFIIIVIILKKYLFLT